MNLTINAIEEKDYEKFVEWGIFFKFPFPPKNMLPSNALGGLKITNEEGIDICCGYLYETNSDIAWLEWIFSNPNIKDKELRKKALTELIYYLTLHAEQKGFKAVFSSIKEVGLIEKYKKNGYSESKLNSKEMIINFNT
jgi:hypothetical protein